MFHTSSLWTYVTSYVYVRQSLLSGPGWRLSQKPESLWGCSSQSVQASRLEFHTVIFVLKDTMPCHQDGYQGLRFHWLLSHKEKLPFALTLASHWQMSRFNSVLWFHYCISVEVKHVTRGRPPFARLTLVAWLIIQTNVLYLEGCFSYCIVQTVIAKHSIYAFT